jgi:hypothetical protein
VTRHIASAVLLLAVGVGCKDGAKRSALAYGNEKDVERFLAGYGAPVTVEGCTNVVVAGGVTRALSCTTKFAPGELASLTGKATLARASVTSVKVGETGRCEGRAGYRSDEAGVEVWSARWGCDSSNRGFLYLELHVVPATGAACVETEYTWGC